MKIKHIIWDWNGTLLDDAQACVEALNVILERRGLPLVDLDQYRNIFRFPVKEYYETLGFDFSTENWDKMAQEFHKIYFDVSRNMVLRSGIIDVLQRLSERGMPMSVLSASESGVLDRLLRDHGIREFFGDVCGLTDIYASSKIEIGRQLVKGLPWDSRDVLLVGDTVHDYEVADDTGCRCALLVGGHQAEHRLKQCGCIVCANLSELAQLWA